eukprot:m.289784 g.289784  ORF g.289784 m.289784 type:complete len:705 (-) comp12189_c0_seq1:223-2337(-)
MEWTVTYSGSMEMPNLQVDTRAAKPDLTEEAIAMCKEIRKNKKNEPRSTLNLFVDPDSLQGTPVGPGQPFYQPIGRVIFVHAHTERGMKKSHHVTVIATAEGSVFGSPNSKYICHTFKCKSEDDANAVAYASHRTMMASAQRQRLEQGVAGADRAKIEESVKWWNACNVPLYHFHIDKAGLVTGNMIVHCQVDSSLRAAKKVVKLNAEDCGSPLVAMLSDKFNLGDINPDDYAVFEHRESGEQNMLADDESPVVLALKRMDPCEGTFWLRKVPHGLVRLTTVKRDSVQSEAPRIETTTPNTVDNSPEKNLSSLQSQLGPELPYHEADEDLLLGVMITRQSGSGLGFKLTPAYLLQMCISYCAVQRGAEGLSGLLGKIVKRITAVLDDSPDDPDMMLFWAVNTVKLLESLMRAPITSEAFDLGEFRAILDRTLDELVAAKRNDRELPRPLVKTDWSSKDELHEIVASYCHNIEQNMNRDSLSDVVQRITQAISNPRTGTTPQKLQDPHDVTAPLGSGLETPTSTPLHSTPLVKTLQDMDGNPYNPNATATSTDEGDEEEYDSHLEPLPEEWEELVDQDTKHRFFANHITRETSWTDPRDKLTTVTLIKGDKGLGLGISGAKRVTGNRLILGIFVSSLVTGSAAATEGSLAEGDEILEVNGRSLIGVTREEAIEELKRVRLNEHVVLLVSQEPRHGDRNKFRHTAL